MSDALNQVSIGKLYSALAKAQGAFKRIGKDKRAEAGKYGYSYADLADVLDSVRQALASHELSIVQLLGTLDGKTTLTTRICHSSGAHIDSEWTIPFGNASKPQDMGIAITYARRYAALAILGVHPDDEDSDAAEIGPARKRQQRPANASSGDGYRFASEYDSIDQGMRAARTLETLNEIARRVKAFPPGESREELAALYRQEKARITGRSEAA